MTVNDLLNDPSLILSADFDFNKIIDEIPNLINPLINSKCALDEIYIDGLDATQIWPQVQMVLDSAEEGLKEDINRLSGEYTTMDNEEEEEEDEEDEENSEEEAFGEKFEDDSEEEGSIEFQSTHKGEREGEEEEEEEEEEDFEKVLVDGKNDENESNGSMSEEDKEDDEDDDEKGNNVNDDDFELKPKKDQYGLNDDFFDLQSYQKQVLALEDKDTLDDDGEGDEESIDLFADIDDEEDDEMYTYGDYFKEQVDAKTFNEKRNKKTKGKKVKFSKDLNDSDLNEGDFNDAYSLAMADMMDGEKLETEEQDPTVEAKTNNLNSEPNLSTFEKQQLALQDEIEQLEKESIAEKKWTMKGEVRANQRDSESALVEELEFDRNAKPVPVITQEVTESLEEIIRRRIRNDQFDDIPKRVISELTNFKPSQKVDIDERKSKKSLAEIYEDEYNDKENNNEKVSEELKAAHDEITTLWDKVNWELDSLYSAHFVPKPKQKLMDVKVQTSTVSLEDAQPLTMGDTQRLAPQEIYRTNTKVGKDEVQLRSGVIMAKGELERDDKARIRRAKKRKQHNQDKSESIKKKKVASEQL